MIKFLNLIKRVLFFDKTAYDEIKENKSSVFLALLVVYVTILLLSSYFLFHRLTPADNSLPICPGAGNKVMTAEYIKLGSITVSHLPIITTERRPYQYIMNCRSTDSTSAELLSDVFPFFLFGGFVHIFLIIGYTIVLHIIAHLMGGRSNFGIYLFAMCLTVTPFALLGALLLIGKDIGYVGLVVAFIWSMIITIQATKEIKCLSYGKTLIIVLIASLLFFNHSGGKYEGGSSLILMDQNNGDMNLIGVLIPTSEAKEATCYALLDGEKRPDNYWTINRTRDDFERLYDGVTKELYGSVSVQADIRYEHWVRVCCKTDQVRDNKYQCSDLRIDPKIE
jgi:hypothetical protein